MSLNWKRFSLPDSLSYSADVKARGAKQIAARLAEFWVKLLDAVGETCRDDEWEVIYVEVIADEGAVVGYPGRRRWSREARVRVDVRIAWYEARGRALRQGARTRLAAADGGGSGWDWGRDEEYREGYQELFKDICRLLRASVAEEGVAEALQQARARKDVAAHVLDAPNGMMVRRGIQIL